MTEERDIGLRIPWNADERAKDRHPPLFFEKVGYWDRGLDEKMVRKRERTEIEAH